MLFCAFLALLLAGCDISPYPTGETKKPILYLALADDVKTFDPSIGYDVASEEIINPIYPAYFKYDYLKRDPFVLDLCLGAEPPLRVPYPYTQTVNGKQVAKTGESWTFHIKHGLRFQDDPCFPGGKGREITAADFLYSFKRMADPAVTCPIVQYFDDKIFGMKEYEAHVTDLEKRRLKPDYNYPIQGLQLDPNDPYTFRILLNQPYPQLRFLMAMSFTSPLAHEAVDRYGMGLATHPVGCGAFILKDYKPKGHVVLVENPNRMPEYYPSEGAPGDREAGLLADAGRQLPLVSEVDFTIVKEGVTAWNQFLQGYLDSSGVSQNNFQQVMSHPGELSPEMQRRGVTMHKAVSLEISYYIFNMKDSVFGGYTERKRKLRQAISLAINSQEEIDLLSLGLGKPAQFLIPPGLFGYDPDYKNPFCQYNLQKAKLLLAEAGYPNGIDPKTGERLTLYYDNIAVDAQGRQDLALTTKEIQALGIQLVSRSWRYPVFQDKVQNGEFQFISYGWVADYPDPENFVFLLYGPNKLPGPNESNYSNPEYDKIFEQMQVMDDTPQRRALIYKLRDIAVQDCPLIYRQHPESYGLIQPWLHNSKPNPVAMDTIKYIDIDGRLRARLQSQWNHPDYWPVVGAFLFLIAGSLPAANVVRRRMNRHVRRHHEVIA